jgi:hypothetical protein
MAISHVLKQADGNPVRSSMSEVNMDGLDSFLSGTVLGLTVVTVDGAGDDVDASEAIAYTSTGVEDNKSLMDNLVATLQATLAGATVRYSQNQFDQYILHIEAIAQLAQDVDISAPVFTAGT